MKLGVFTVLYQDLSFEAMLDKVVELGIEAVEIGTGNYPGKNHCDPDELLNDPKKIEQFLQAIKDRNLTISGLSCQGNPLHPNKEIAEEHHQTWRKTVQLAKKLNVDVVNVFSGCPGDSPNAKLPNWVTCSWPPEYEEIKNWQWDEVVVPYWTKEAEFAAEHGVKIAFEMHPGFVVYNPETLVELRERTGSSNIGANFDPSHLIWQGIDPVKALKFLGKKEMIYHFHAKDTYLDAGNIEINGVLDTKHYSNILDRSWTFRTIGYGSSEKMWRDIISTLKAIGFDDVVSIEHEDMLASIDEGLKQAISMLQNVMLKEQPGEMWWS
ncbi:sugar phosphate isomerase/epimerase family protein [Halalkalibacterium ligniniphilum]|uniref:sugar phosphate isomerase/epimerase family protein n=1 Tax=Halalkalibacterium ligniniphilum TaxID=1134413 RepID=UPI00034CA7CC|nr:sugar phosphate isomerase/epimerase [Halalkalibacterium ligniniphilum]